MLRRAPQAVRIHALVYHAGMNRNCMIKITHESSGEQGDFVHRHLHKPQFLPPKLSSHQHNKIQLLRDILLHHSHYTAFCTTTSYSVHHLLPHNNYLDYPAHASPPSLHRLHRQPTASLHKHSPLRRSHPPQLSPRNPCISPFFKEPFSCQWPLLLRRRIHLMAISQPHERQWQMRRLSLEILVPQSPLKRGSPRSKTSYCA